MKNFAILGAGRIARKMAETVNAMNARGDAVQLYAIAARDEARAADFAADFHIPKAYGSYEEMLSDPAIDLVYVATPHAMHAEHMKLCLEHGKAVLCEKAFTGNAKQAEEVLNLSKEKNILVAEAIWPRYLPSRKMMQDIIDSGELGEVKLVTANLGYAIEYKERIVRPELAGGALLDLGVYTLNFVEMLIDSEVTDLRSIATMQPSGVDLAETICMTFANGVTAQLMNTAQVPTDRRGIVYGTKAYMVADNVNSVTKIDIYSTTHELIRSVQAPAWINGFEYEVQACLDALDQGRIECPQMPHSEILRIMKQMDTLRAQWNMVYPFD